LCNCSFHMAILSLNFYLSIYFLWTFPPLYSLMLSVRIRWPFPQMIDSEHTERYNFSFEKTKPECWSSIYAEKMFLNFMLCLLCCLLSKLMPPFVLFCSLHRVAHFRGYDDPFPRWSTMNILSAIISHLRKPSQNSDPLSVSWKIILLMILLFQYTFWY